MADTDFFSASDPYIDQVFGDEFTVKELIGMGGMGTVYRAEQAVTEREVALKVLHRHLSGEVLVKRFQQEARIISKLNHPHVVTIYKYGQHTDGALYIAMELAKGRTLTDLIQSRALFDPKRYVPLMMQIVDAVAYAHDLKIIHRDIKPENVVVVRSGRKERVKVLDFGIAKIVDTKYVITKTGMLCGSPPFMAPEQWAQARDLDGRVDIYSLGVLFYAMVTGHLPYDADNTPGYMNLHLAGNPVPPIQRSDTLHQVPALNDIILRCMKTSRSDRYADAYELLEVLKAVYLELQTSTGSVGDGTGEELSDPRKPTQSAQTLPHPSDPMGGTDAEPVAEAGVTLAYSEKSAIDSDQEPLYAPSRSRVDIIAGSETLADESANGDGAVGEDGSETSLQWTRQTLVSDDERSRARKVHLLFVSAGLFMLLFLALTFVYLVWFAGHKNQSREPTSAPAPAETSTVPTGKAALMAPDAGRQRAITRRRPRRRSSHRRKRRSRR